MSDFTAGFAARFDAAAQALHHAYSQSDRDFAPNDLKARASGRRATDRTPQQAGPVSFSPQPVGPRHFAPADPDGNPTEGWNPLDSTTPAAASAGSTFTDPIAAARAAAYREGFGAGQEQGALERERDQALLRTLGEALKSAERVDRDQIAARLRQTVLFLVSKMVGDIGIAPDLLARRIEAATDMIADGAEAALLKLNPDDLPLIADLLPATIHSMGDASVDRGSFVLESPSTIVEDGPELWLEQLAQAIERVGVPPLGQ
jgi:flagellar assembly protein FliH